MLSKILAQVWIPNFSNRLVLSPIERKVQVVGMVKMMCDSEEVRWAVGANLTRSATVCAVQVSKGKRKSMSSFYFALNIFWTSDTKSVAKVPRTTFSKSRILQFFGLAVVERDDPAHAAGHEPGALVMCACSC